MPHEPPKIASEGDSPTRWEGDGEGAGAPGKDSAPGMVSAGESPTWAEDQLQPFLPQGSELDPDLIREQKSVLLKPGDVVAKRFEVVKQLGFGGMGAVYHVKDRHLGLEKALKVMLPSLLASETARQRFRSEVAISQQLRHENIVTVYDLAADKRRGFYFFTMEYVEGKTLHRVLQERGGRLPVEEALDITRQLCDALEYAHKNTIHRDLKPQNIMVRPDGAIKVLDFGLAKLMSPGRLTKSSMALGTAYYQAPEQSIHLRELDARADIYSVGVVLYQMLTGEIPVGRVKSPSQISAGTPKGLDTVVLTCLEPNAEDRPESAAALREALEQAGQRTGKAQWAVSAVAAVVVLVFAVFLMVGRQGPAPVGPEGRAGARPSQPGGTVEESGTVPSRPPSADSLGTVPDSATAADASAAKVAAVTAQQAAKDAGAEQHAEELFKAGAEALKDGEAHDRLRAFAAAVEKYQEAEGLFTKAKAQGEKVSAEITAYEKAKASLEKEKKAADALDAATWAKTRYEQAVEVQEQALLTEDRVKGAELLTEAAGLFKLAASETAQQGEAIVAAARKAAEQAKQSAQTEAVSKYASQELADADRLMKEADEKRGLTQAKRGTSGDGSVPAFHDIKALYEQATAKYAEAATVAGERLAAAKGDAETARKDALASQKQIGTDERKYAEDEVAAGDRAWSSAEEALADGDYAKAAEYYGAAETQYAKAVEVTPERKLLAQAPKAGQTRSVDLGGGVTLELVWIPPGDFMMGSPAGEENRDDDETQHRVTLTKGFWLGKYEVTQAQWRAVMGNTIGQQRDKANKDWPLRGEGADYPIYYVSWDDCQAFIKRLNAKGQGTFRLPTEAEWEYACRAGSTTAYCFGDSSSTLGSYGWYNENSGSKTHSVGGKSANAWGLHDMHGNVWEWCQDWHGTYPSGSVTDPTGPSAGSYRVARGGSWYFNPRYCRSAVRSWSAPGDRYDILGFRLARP